MMCGGYVTSNHEAIIPVVVVNGEQRRSIKAVIDTGFTGYLSLPKNIIGELGLDWQYVQPTTLGDGQEVEFDIYAAQIIWDGQRKNIEVGAAETEPLLGMQLLRGYRLQVDVENKGSVRVQSLTEIER